MTSAAPPARPADTARAPVPAAPWLRAFADARAPVAPFAADASLLVVAAHPDDEAIGLGRLLADHDGPVRCVTLTAGERCHGQDADAQSVARTRLDEWGAALRLLGAEPVETQRWPDGRLTDHEREATDLVSSLVGDADVVLAPWRYDPHPDHEAAGRIAAAVSRRTGRPLWSYLVWTPYWLEPGDLARKGAELTVWPTSARADRLRLEAIACHHSQTVPHPPAENPVVPALLVERHSAQLLVREPIPDAHDREAGDAESH